MRTRRAFLIGSAGLVVAAGASGYELVENRVLPGRHWLNRNLGRDDTDPGLPAAMPGRMVSGSFSSPRRRGATVGYTIAYPPSAPSAARVVVVLHGRGVDHREAFSPHLGLEHFLAAGGHRFALAAVDGGDTYWHRRVNGEDAAGMVIEEFLPRLAQHGLQTAKIGLLGWSMGGFGALHLARLLGRARVAAVTAESVAIWHRAGQSADGAFDGPTDFAECDVFSHTAALAGIPIRIDCGTDDGFEPVDRDYLTALNRSVTPKPAGFFEAGGHDQSYWRRAAPAQLSFLANYLA